MDYGLWIAQQMLCMCAVGQSSSTTMQGLCEEEDRYSLKQACLIITQQMLGLKRNGRNYTV